MQREFLGWDAPFLGRAVDRLWARRHELPATLVVVPTAQAGRRLRQALAERGGCLGPRVTTPGRLLAAAVAAPDAAEVAAWMGVLEGVDDWDRLAAAFPVAPGRGEPAGWALALAKSLAGLRRTLSDNGMTIGGAARVLAPTVEGERWRALAGLEAAVEETLGRLGVESRSRQFERLARDGLAGTGAVVLAGICDLPPVLARALRDRNATCLIAAPDAEADAFDEWGRPRVEAWAERELAWPARGEVVLCADPRQQADNAVALVAKAGTPSDELALGSADEETAGELARAFTRAGWTAHHPGARTPAPAATWLAAWRAFVERPDAAAAIDLLGLPGAGVLVGGLRAQRVRALAAARDVWLARDRADLARAGELGPRDPGQLALARETLELLERRRGGFLGDGFAAAAARLLDQVDPGGGFAGAREWLAAMDRVLAAAGRPAGVWLELLADALDRDGPPPPDGRVVDVQGWLELLHEPGRHLVVCGMNEGKVPAPAAGETWLPDAARRLLGLATDAGRAARDAFLLRAMVEARRAGGRVDMLLGKAGAGGDALLPSRLLLAAGGAELARRVGLLFAGVAPPEAGLAWQCDWRWRPRAEAFGGRLSVTAFRDYLACPFRFYLKHVLGMVAAEPERVGWNARDFGTIAHTVLEAWGRDAEAREFSKVEALEAWLDAALERVVAARFGERVPLAVRIQADALRRRLAWFARVQACEAAAGWRVEAVEHKFEFALGGVTVVGKADRIDRHRDGRRRVLDYKTYARRRPVEGDHRVAVTPATVLPQHLEGVEAVLCPAANGKAMRWTNLQVPLYSAGLGAIDELGYFILGASQGEVGIELWNGFHPADAGSALACAGWVAARIAAGAFWPPAGKVKYDDAAVLAMGRPLAEVVEPGGLAQ